MHAAWGDGATGLKIEERGYGLDKTYDLIVWCLDQFKKTDDLKSAELVKTWIDKLVQAARVAGAQCTKRMSFFQKLSSGHKECYD